MTDRIQELKNKTLDEHFNYTWSTMGYEDISKFAEKFAEMIVQECANIADVNAHQYQTPGTYILKHFGVE